MSKINELNKQKLGFSEYANMDGTYMPTKPHITVKHMPPGIYHCDMTPMGSPYFKPTSTMTDSLVEMKNHTSDEVYNDISKFWQKSTREKFDKNGLIYKRGILLYGPPGTGKTCAIAKVMETVVKQGGYVFFEPNPYALFVGANILREIEGDVPILVVYEEFDDKIDRDNAYLGLLDGQIQINNVVFLATTNYIDKIPNRIKKRPSRFAKVLEVGFPSLENRIAFLTNKLTQYPEVNVKEWAKLTDGFTIDQLKDLIVSVLCLDVPLADAVEKLKDLTPVEEDLDDDADYMMVRKSKEQKTNGLSIVNAMLAASGIPRP